MHDGPALRLSALTLQLGLLKEKLQVGTANLQRDIDDLQRELHTVLQELRATIANFDLDAAVAEVKRNYTGPLTVGADLQCNQVQ